MTYKDKEKQKQAQRERTRRYRERLKGVTAEGVTGQGVTPKQGKLLEDIFGKELLESGLPDDKPQAHDPSVQKIWDKRNAQGQAGGYSDEAQTGDYPQAQRPMR